MVTNLCNNNSDSSNNNIRITSFGIFIVHNLLEQLFLTAVSYTIMVQLDNVILEIILTINTMFGHFSLDMILRNFRHDEIH